jgi:PAS domain S-box-containing protein
VLETELFSLLENTGDAAYVMRESGEICFWNSSAEDLFGFTAAEVIGKSCASVLEGVGPLGTHVCNQRCSALQCVQHSTRVPNFDLHVITRSGERIWINVSSIIFLNPRTSRKLLVHLARDISTHKRQDDMFRKMVALSREVSALEDTTPGAVPVAPLSTHETEILRMFAEGKRASQIAQALAITPQTLRNHLHHINQKFGTHNRLEAVMHALQRRLI